MKELSIEEKARRYDDAIEKAKSKIKNDKDHVLYENDVIEIFPELAESKDERIELLNYLYDVHDDDEERARWIAWLEKQGKKKHTAEEVLIKAGLKPYKDGDQWCVLLGDNIQEGICGFGNTIEDALYAFLKDLIASQGWQKSNGTFVNVDDVREDFVQEVYRVLDADSTNDRANQIIDAFDNLPTVAIEKQGEQKPADITNKLKEEYQRGWDAAMQQLPKEVDSQIWQIANNSAKTWEESFAILCASQKAYDKGKKDALKEQKPAAWSEEDRQNLDSIIAALTYCNENGVSDCFVDPDILIDWLKSLKERYTWKPCDYELEVLRLAAEKDGTCLMGLYEQLKKLREE